MHVEMQLYFLLLNKDKLHTLINNCNMFVGSKMKWDFYFVYLKRLKSMHVDIHLINTCVMFVNFELLGGCKYKIYNMTLEAYYKMIFTINIEITPTTTVIFYQ